MNRDTSAHGVSASELAALSFALELARRGPAHGPNPRVGCVLLADDGVQLASGYHRGAGTPHAEADALANARAAGVDVRGATAVVTLEPCNHTGRTGPCAEALIEAGVGRVVFAVADPNPTAAGGAERLRAAGIATVGPDSGMSLGPATAGPEAGTSLGAATAGPEAGTSPGSGSLEGFSAKGATGSDAWLRAMAEARTVVRPWLTALERGRPFVTLKSATTLDGRIAAADGSSRWITSVESRTHTHAFRAEVDAIVVGTGTALEDDPSLTARTPEGTLAEHQPLRVVVGHRDLPEDASLRGPGGELLHLRSHDPAAVLAELHAREIRHVLVEGGATLAAAFLRAGLVDELHAYIAPVLLGAGKSAIGELGITSIGGAARWETTSVERLGPDVLIVATPAEDTPAEAPPLAHDASRRGASPHSASPRSASPRSASPRTQ